jgi:hypothetical protein
MAARLVSYPPGVRLQAARDPPVRSAASAETALQTDDAAAPGSSQWYTERTS